MVVMAYLVTMVVMVFLQEMRKWDILAELLVLEDSHNMVVVAEATFQQV